MTAAASLTRYDRSGRFVGFRHHSVSLKKSRISI